MSSSSSSSYSILCSQGLVVATAMAAVSGTAILFAIRQSHNKSSFPALHHDQVLRSCISSEGKKRNKKKKKVHFAESVITDRRREEDEEQRSASSKLITTTSIRGGGKKERTEMPANRMALYSAILKDRGVQRLAYSNY